MSNMDGNQNYEEAERFVNEASEINAWPLDERAIIARAGRTLATLALAYEQRTANMLHALEISYRAQGTGLQIDPQIIAERLGLNEAGATK